MPQPAILFDIGNVLLRFDFAIAAQRFAERSIAAADAIIPLLTPFKDDLESGKLSSEEFVRQAMDRIGFRGVPAEFVQIWVDIFTENEAMVPLVSGLAGQFSLYLLSNTNALHRDFFMDRFPVFRHFSGGVYSHEARCMKPHEPIYRQAIVRFSLDPGLTYYIDDLPENLATARRLGWTCHHYRLDDHDSLETSLRQWRRSVLGE